MNIYRIYVENKGTNTIAEIIQTVGFMSFSILPGMGYWKGRPETVAVVEIIQAEAARHDILELAETLRSELDQEAVLVTTQRLDGFEVVDNCKSYKP